MFFLYHFYYYFVLMKWNETHIFHVASSMSSYCSRSDKKFFFLFFCSKDYFLWNFIYFLFLFIMYCVHEINFLYCRFGLFLTVDRNIVTKNLIWIRHYSFYGWLNRLMTDDYGWRKFYWMCFIGGIQKSVFFRKEALIETFDAFLNILWILVGNIGLLSLIRVLNKWSLMGVIVIRYGITEPQHHKISQVPNQKSRRSPSIAFTNFHPLPFFLDSSAHCFNSLENIFNILFLFSIIHVSKSTDTMHGNEKEWEKRDFREEIKSSVRKGLINHCQSYLIYCEWKISLT